jgi:hypothetical protein
MKHPHSYRTSQGQWDSRREILRLFGGTATALLFGCGRDSSFSGGANILEPAASAAVLPACVVRSEQTEGPYFVDAKGVAEFLTIYPGWYEGRAVHIHFKIRTDVVSRRGFEFISQLYFDESITDQVFKQAPYNGKGGRRTMNDADFIFRNGGKQLIPTMRNDSQGYVARFDIGLQRV